MNNQQLPIHFDKRTLPIIKTFHGDATISGVDFSNSFVDAGFTYVEVRYCLIDEAYHHSNFFIGHFKRDFVERILDKIDILNSSKQTS